MQQEQGTDIADPPKRGGKTIFVSSTLIANQALNNKIVRPTGVPSNYALIIEERMPFDPDTECPPFFCVKTQKSLSRRAQWLLGKGAMMLYSVNNP